MTNYDVMDKKEAKEFLIKNLSSEEYNKIPDNISDEELIKKAEDLLVDMYIDYVNMEILMHD